MVLADITGREDLLYELGIQADGKIVASGISPTLPGIWHFTTARFNSAGSLDSTFGTGGGVITQIEGYSRPFSLAFQGDGKILVAGSATTGSALVRYNRDGSLDLSFGSEGKVVTSFDNRLFAIVSMAVQPDGKIVGGGTLSNEISKEDFCVLRYEAGCVQYITSSSQSISANGGIGSISVSNIGDCPWTAVSNNPEFITITSTDNETVTFTVTPNLNTTPRSGTITVVDQVFMVFQGAAFLDVPPSHPFYTEIGRLSARGITLGCGDGNYCPDQVVSREQMAAFIIRALGDFNPPAPVTQSFTDVPPENPFYAFIEQIALRKITLGCGGGNYCPSDPVLREQKAAFIIRALHPPGYIPPEPAMQRFLDVP